MKSKRVIIEVSEKESVSVMISLPDHFESGTAVIVAHGAGNDMNNPLLVLFCEHLADAGYLAVRFNFPYKEHGRKAPDRQPLLEDTWQRVFHFVKTQPDFSLQKIIVAGKSMGGRVAAEMLAGGSLVADGIVFLGYPLHPAGNKEKLRDAHLYHIKCPMLFFEGTRDTLCDLDILKVILERLGPRAKLEVIEGGDHSFNVPKKSSLTVQDVYREIAARSIEWMSKI